MAGCGMLLRIQNRLAAGTGAGELPVLVLDDDSTDDTYDAALDAMLARRAGFLGPEAAVTGAVSLDMTGP
mgnify:CR=1 FL=1